MAEEVYGLTLVPALCDGSNYDGGPTPDPQSLMDRVTDPDLAAEIHLLRPFAENEVAYRWLFGTWVDVAKNVPIPNPFFENDPGRKIILDKWNLTDQGNEILMVTCRVAGFTIEAKAGDYQSTRGYVQLEPEDLKIHVPVYNPGQKIDQAGDVEIFGSVFRYIATELDMAVVDIANRRLDRAIAVQDVKGATAITRARRVDAGKEVRIEETVL